MTDVEEPGEVVLSTLQPQDGTPIMATLTDQDGKPRNDDGIQPDPTIKDLTTLAATTRWQWSRSARASGPWTDIAIEDETTTSNMDESNTPTYEPTEDDVGMYLRATATYEDGHCSNPCDPKKTAHAVSANPVQADPSNKAPMFQDEKGTI